MLNWKAAAKGQRVELRKWRSGEYFLHPTGATEAQREAYVKPWWSAASCSCIVCHDPNVPSLSNVCVSCQQELIGE